MIDKFAIGFMGLMLMTWPAMAQNWKGDEDDLAKAVQAARVAKDADAAKDSADTATRIQITVMGDRPERGPQRRTSLAVTPADPEWAAVVAAVKSLAAKKATKAKADLNAMKITVEPKAEPEPATEAPGRK